MTTRRDLLLLTSSALAIGYTPRAMGAPVVSDTAADALTESDLVYITPIRSNGRESRCQAEVWYAWDGNEVMVVTPPDTWRARAISRGLTSARLWVGDHGVWSKSNAAYRDAPGFDAVGSIDKSDSGHEQALEALGDKYPLQWVLWGPRFRKGLSDGSRVLLRYRPTA